MREDPRRKRERRGIGKLVPYRRTIRYALACLLRAGSLGNVNVPLTEHSYTTTPCRIGQGRTLKPAKKAARKTGMQESRRRVPAQRSPHPRSKAHRSTHPGGIRSPSLRSPKSSTTAYEASSNVRLQTTYDRAREQLESTPIAADEAARLASRKRIASAFSLVTAFPVVTAWLWRAPR